MKIYIRYAENHAWSNIPLTGQGEWVEGEDAGPGLVRLTGWGSSVRLVPGDVVRVRDTNEGPELTAIEELAPVWLFEVATQTPNMMLAPGLDNPDSWDVAGLDDDNWDAAELVANEVGKELANATAVHQTTKVTFRLITETREWFDRFCATNPHVQYYWEVRRPGQAFDLQHELRDLGISELPMFDQHGARIN